MSVVIQLELTLATPGGLRGTALGVDMKNGAKNSMATFWKVLFTAVISIFTMVVLYLAMPLASKVERQSQQIADLRTKNAVLETRLDEIDRKLDMVLELLREDRMGNDK